MNEDDEHPSTTKELETPERLLALTDGVFAIVMTILVLELHVPPPTDGGWSHDQVSELLLRLFLYAAGFLLAGVYWVGHRAMFALVKKVNTMLVWANVVFLMLASLIPFAASFMGTYPHLPRTLQAYGLLLFVLASYRLFMYRYITSHHELLFAPVQPSVRNRVTQVMCTAPALFLVSIIISPFQPTVALLLNSFTPVMFVTLITLANRPIRKKSDEGI